MTAIPASLDTAYARQCGYQYDGCPVPDGCPRCIAGFAVVPFAVEDDRQDHTGVYCWYRCPRCRYLWRCAWGVWDAAGDVHQWPDTHSDRECPCGCSLLLLRSAVPLGGAA